MPSILIVDDEAKFGELLQMALVDAGYEARAVCDPLEGLRLAGQHAFDVVLSDLRMPRMEGLELVEAIRKVSPETQFVLMTAFASLESAIGAVKRGVADYIIKPFKVDDLLGILARIFERQRLIQENDFLKERLSAIQRPHDIKGRSSRMMEAVRLAQKVAGSDVTVLIRGESGTGKELIARLIHFASPRAACPLVEINCAAIPENLLESELFGFEKGSFTGAVASKRGKFELADGGTIFLDEVGELAPSLQVKLLRVIQERTFERIGGLRAQRTNTRILAATNLNMEEAMRRGRFREDLYYRLNVVTIPLPALRERPEDIPELVAHFLARLGRPRMQVAPDAMASLCAYHWPGNVRELENVIERAIVIGEGDTLRMCDLPFGLIGSGSAPAPGSPPAPGFEVPGTHAGTHLDSGATAAGAMPGGVSAPLSGSGGGPGEPPAARPGSPVVGAPAAGATTAGIPVPGPGFSIDEWERKIVLEAYEKAGRMKTRTAQYLGITRRQLDSRLRRFGID